MSEYLTAIGISEQIVAYMAPAVTLLLGIVISLWFKDFATRIAKGVTFKFFSTFSEGDKVLLDNEQALIVKVGVTTTVFGILKSDGNYTWRYVPNERIPFIKLERVIFDKYTPHYGDDNTIMKD